MTHTGMTLREKAEAVLADDGIALEDFGEKFYEAFRTDSPDYRWLLNYYAGGDSVRKTVMNETVMSLCGWSMETLLDRALDGIINTSDD